MTTNDIYVKVDNTKEWKDVLDYWFSNGSDWKSVLTYHEGEKQVYRLDLFKIFPYSPSVLALNVKNKSITQDKFYPNVHNSDEVTFFTYEEFMTKYVQSSDIFVSEYEYDLLEFVKEHHGTSLMQSIHDNYAELQNIRVGKKKILRYLGGDSSIELKIKEPQYRLYLIDKDGERVYFRLGENSNIPFHTSNPKKALVDIEENIKEWKTPAWSIERAD